MGLKKEELAVLALAVFLFLGFILFISPSTTGYAIYDTESNNYFHDTSLINISDSEVKLIPSITTTSSETITENIVQVNIATQNGLDKLSKINSLNAESAEIKENDADDILNFVFAENLENNDIISVYFTHNKNTDSSICEPSILCSTPYSSMNYNGNPSYINFTLELKSARNSFGIFPITDKTRIDYIYATHFTTNTNTTTTISYPSLGYIETTDIEPTNIKVFDYVNYEHTLNNQNIEYYYSSDSGEIWEIITDQNISSLNLTKIRIKAILHSDGTSTPIINSLSLIYSELQENSTEQNTTQTQNDFVREIETEDNHVYLKVYSEDNLSNAVITITPSNLTQPDKNKLKAIEINSDINFSSAILRINYTEEELGNINESSLKMFFYNENSDSWEEVQTVINLNENYLEANLTHFSIYGVFGDLKEQQNTESSPQSSTSSSSSGGSRNPSSKVAEKIVQELPLKEENEEITLFGEQKAETKKRTILPTTQAVREVEKPGYFGAYLFVILIMITYLLYNKHTKKPNSTRKSRNKKA